MKLTQKQLESLLQEPRLDNRGKNLYALCPWCGHDEFGISLGENHPWNCFRKKKCEAGSGNIYTLLKKLGKTRQFLNEREINSFEKLNSKLRQQKNDIDIVLPEIQKPLLWKRSYDDQYCIKRGILSYQFEKFEIGRSRVNQDYVTILIRMNGRLVGYISRSDKDKTWIDDYNKRQKQIGSKNFYLRYKNSDTDFSKCLFGYDEINENTTDVILVEGPFSKTKTDVNLELDNSDTVKCCATFGSHLTIEQIELLKLKGVKNIWLWFEADVLDQVKHVASEAALHFNVLVSYLNKNDPNEIDSVQAIALMENAKNFLDFNTSYVKSNILYEK